MNRLFSFISQYRPTSAFYLMLIIFMMIFLVQINMVQATESVVVRKPGKEHLKELKSDSDFNYGNDFKEEKGLLSRLWEELLRKIEKLLNKTDYDNFWKYVYIAVIITVVVLILKKAYGRNISFLLKPNNKSMKIDYEVSEENIHELNLDALIAKSIDEKNYRLAVRYQYLKTLKLLSDKQIISWKPEKTNRSYLYELNDLQKRSEFEKITMLFEYAWYGDKPVNAEIFETGSSHFNNFNKAI